MGLVAVFGDSHGNKEALDAVLRSIAARVERGAQITHFICTGDLVGYGPDPRYCVQKVYELSRNGNLLAVVGNHDLAARDKIAKPELILAENTGMTGSGAYEGIHWAVRQLCGDSTRIPIENKPPKPAQGEDPDQYKQALYDWRQKQVEPQTQQVIRDALAYGHDKGLARGATNALFVDSRVGVSLKDRFKPGSDIARSTYRAGLEHATLDELRANRHQVGNLIESRENSELRAYLNGLQPELRGEIKVDDKTIPIMVVHDNPFKPGDATYLVDKERHRKMRRRSDARIVDEVFAEWDTSNWKDVQVICFGHSHFDGVYADKDRLIINPGTVGIPRGDSLEATYALWNPAMEGKNSVEIVRIKRAGWRMTREKMKMYGLPDKFEHIHAEVA